MIEKLEWRMQMRRLLASIASNSPAESSSRNDRIAVSIHRALETRPGIWLAFVASHDEPIVDVAVEGIQYAYPSINADRRTMDFYRAKAAKVSWVKNKFMLNEPDLTDSNWEIVPREGLLNGAIRGALLPALGYDRGFHRLGRGGGFYDKYLMENHILKIGIAFAEQLVDELPTEPHDITVDAVITDQEVLWKQVAA